MIRHKLEDGHWYLVRFIVKSGNDYRYLKYWKEHGIFVNYDTTFSAPADEPWAGCEWIEFNPEQMFNDASYEEFLKFQESLPPDPWLSEPWTEEEMIALNKESENEIDWD